jgi:hypothetical protein
VAISLVQHSYTAVVLDQVIISYENTSFSRDQRRDTFVSCNDVRRVAAVVLRHESAFLPPQTEIRVTVQIVTVNSVHCIDSNYIPEPMLIYC